MGRRSEGYRLRRQIVSRRSKSFFIDYRLDGRQRRYTIGPFPRWSAEAAREQAKKLRKEIDQGVDPAGDKRARRIDSSLVGSSRLFSPSTKSRPAFRPI